VKSRRARARALVVGLCLVGTALADAPAFQAHTPPESAFHAIGPETPEWPNRLNIEYEGRATIRAKYRFVYDAENGYEQNPHLFLLPDRESQAQLPYLTRWVFESDTHPTKVLRTDAAEEIWVTNVGDAAIALLGQQLAKEVMAGKHEKVVGEAIVVIEGFSAGYECDSPSFGTLFVEVKDEVSPPSLTKHGMNGC
jgi:hypothetical protein